MIVFKKCHFRVVTSLIRQNGRQFKNGRENLALVEKILTTF